VLKSNALRFLFVFSTVKLPLTVIPLRVFCVWPSRSNGQYVVLLGKNFIFDPIEAVLRPCTNTEGGQGYLVYSEATSSRKGTHEIRERLSVSLP